MQAAYEAVHEAVTRLLQGGEHDPQHLVLALARATGELGADIAQAGGMEAEELLGDLAELVRLAGQEPRWPGAPEPGGAARRGPAPGPRPLPRGPEAAFAGAA